MTNPKWCNVVKSKRNIVHVGVYLSHLIGPAVAAWCCAALCCSPVVLFYYPIVIDLITVGADWSHRCPILDSSDKRGSWTDL